MVTCSGCVMATISDLEKTFVNVSSNVTVVVGHPLRIPCEPPVGIPPVNKLSWLHNDNEVQGDNRTMLRHRKLSIIPAEIGDTGFYQCVADNGYFVRTSVKFYVHVSFSKSCLLRHGSV